MSWEALSYVRGLRIAPNGERLTRSEKLVLLILADCHNIKKRIAWPSVATIAEEALLCEREVRKLLRTLEQKGVIRTIQPPRTGSGYTSCYKFLELDPDDSMERQAGPVLHRATPSLQNANVGQEGGKILQRRGNEVGTLGDHNKEEHKHKELEQNHYAGVASVVSHSQNPWERIKTKLACILPEEEFNFWVRPSYLARIHRNGAIVYLPPNVRMHARARASRELIMKTAHELGMTWYAGTMFLRYPVDEHERYVMRTGHAVTKSEFYLGAK